MKYRSEKDFAHDRAPATGVLMVNLGTPESPDRAAVRRYLREFLWDPRVVEMSRPLWWLVLNGIVLNTRPARSAHAYASIWRNDGSPLLVVSRAQQQALAARLASSTPPVHVALAMRYGNPSIAEGLDELARAGARRLLVLPMYPQYSATTTASVFDAVTAELRRWRWVPELRFVNQYHDHPAYIDALAASVRAFRAEHGTAELLLMSFHGIPREYFDAGDPYHCHCRKTARLLAEALGLDEADYRVSFQSRLGPREWLKPYTDESLKSLPGEGVRRVQLICPGFSADCLETLEEIAMQNRDLFMAAGGEDFQYIPCLNDDPAHIDALADIVATHTRGWHQESFDGTATRERAVALGALR